MELLMDESSPYTIVGFDILDHRGKRVKVRARCELCAFAEVIEEHDALKCRKTGLMVVDDGRCDEFNITKLMMDDIYNGCIK